MQFEASWEPFGCLLVLFLGPLRESIEASWGALGVSWGALGASWEIVWAGISNCQFVFLLLGPSSASLWPSWVPPGRFGALFGRLGSL